ncbi:uncharacterized protein BCR38DRAFT_405014 [Pseudomassariella vexata]|uniref:Eisosome protein 1 n=1 Tax=Pseudomassariella vexata TaxID=1141098 RepID=A0A1Y2EKD4_9PEZI|nr:uncharacterized protein BCR38DRAFT_405014 [Pseudomassariella vexata]ORY71997.1 hypothetical protein BCR38DRAFT_405014 [Pseudomassariella vexata]
MVQPGPVGTPPQSECHDEARNVPTAHSGRLVYARPQDLPSFPSVGLKANGSAASAAASLGWANQKSPEPWKPNKSASASAAAILAKDHKMAAAWKPTPSSEGAQAAMLAHKASRTSESRKPSTTDHGHSAAAQAFNAGRNSMPNSRANTLDHRGSLMAAKGAMATRPRANTAPASRESYPDKANAAAIALKAATKAHQPNRSSVPSKEGGAAPYTNMNRQMFISQPAFKLEAKDQTREEELHASAVAMAKKMFKQQQILINQAKKLSANDPQIPRRRRSSSSLSDDVQPMQFNTLQDAAYKLAQERLTKLHEDNMKNRDYQDYYGQGKAPRKFSVRAKLRRRASSDGAVIEDRQRSRQIRKQMSIFSNKLSEVDQKKRQQDRDALLAVAQRNVQARLKGMDDAVAEKTGMVPPSTLSQWEAKAYSAAQARSDNRLSKHGKVDLGAGKYMDQDDINAIAARRVQPVLDEINDKADREHARQFEASLEAERTKEKEEIENAREKEVQDIYKKLKDQEKQEAKAAKDEERAVRAEQKRLAKAAKHRSAPASVQYFYPEDEPAVDDTTEVALNDIGQPVKVLTSPAPATGTGDQGRINIDVPDEHKQKRRTRSGSSSPKSPTGKVKTWFKSRFSRGSKSDDDKPKSKDKDNSQRGFIGGAALTGMTSNNDSSSSVDNRSASVRAVAMAGRRRTDLSDDLSRSQFRSQSAIDPNEVSPMSSSSSEDDFFGDEARDRVGVGLSPPKPIQDPAERKSLSPVRDSRFHEII